MEKTRKRIILSVKPEKKIGKRKQSNTGVLPIINVKSSCNKCRKNGKLFCPITTSCSC
jgi:hypothetical protein